MSVISGIIQPQSFEIVRNRLGVILADEMSNQRTLSGSEDLTFKYYLERFISFDKSEMPALNVTLERGEYGGQTAIQSDGTYRYNIDCYTSAKSTDAQRGDSMAMLKLQRVLGICRAIIEDPQYKTLGFQPGFIMNRHVESISIGDPNSQDAESTVMGRLIVVVKVPETTNLLIPPLVANYQTNVKIGLTERGYIFLPPDQEGEGVFSDEFDFSFN